MIKNFNINIFRTGEGGGMSIRETIEQILENRYASFGDDAHWTKMVREDVSEVLTAIRERMPDMLETPLGAKKVEKYQQGFNTAIDAMKERLK